MRYLAVFPALLLTLTCCANEPVDPTLKPDDLHADYIVGHIRRTAGRMIEADLGYVHGFRRGQELAVFRSDGIAWNPVGIAAMQDMGSHRSGLRVIRGARPARGDIVLVAQALIGYQTTPIRNDFYVTRRILFRRNQNGYDTRATATDTRQLFRQKKNTQKWYRARDKTKMKVTYGSNYAAYKSHRVESLAKQCFLIRRLQTIAPGALESLSSRWQMVLPKVTGYVEPPAPETADADENANLLDDPDTVRNLLPEVRIRFAAEPEAVQEVFALLLGSVAFNPPANTQSFLRHSFKETQFPQIAEQEDTLQQLEEFLASLN